MRQKTIPKSTLTHEEKKQTKPRPVASAAPHSREIQREKKTTHYSASKVGCVVMLLADTGQHNMCFAFKEIPNPILEVNIKQGCIKKRYLC